MVFFKKKELDMGSHVGSRRSTLAATVHEQLEVDHGGPYTPCYGMVKSLLVPT